MKKLLTTSLLLMTVCALAQKVPAVDSKEYQDMKAKGKISMPAQTPKQKNYPVAIDRRVYKKSNQQSNQQSASAFALTAQTPPCSIDNPAGDPSYSALAPNDDSSSSMITLPFSFSFYGDSFNQVFVNNNGNISFQNAYIDYSSTGFPASGYNMIAPFWADVDTRNSTGQPAGSHGTVYYKSEAHRFTVIWYQVGYFTFVEGAETQKFNTFKLIITDGSDPIIGLGNNVGFFYGDMQWTAGEASGGVNGLGGVPATVGANKGGGNNSCFFYQLGRFSSAGSTFDPFSSSNGIDYLDYKCFTFDASAIEDVAVSFTVSNQLCGLNFVALFDNPQNCAIQSYSWDFGDGTTSTAASPTHAYPTDGTYPVKLTVSYSCGVCVSKTATYESQVLYGTASTTGFALDFKSRDFFCTTSFKPALTNLNKCQVNSTIWDFGDGTPTSSEYNLFHTFSQSGTYNVKLTVNVTCGSCPSNTFTKEKQVVHDPQSNFKDTLVEVSTSTKNQVINSTASTFSDVWPLDQYSQQLNQASPFLNGARGVWRNEGQFVYEIERKQAPQTDIATEGTYTLENFNWEHADLSAIPKWVKANSMTQYSSYGYEIENKDVLGVYSSALYDYGGHLPSANGINMKYCEMAFTSFEYLDQKSSGNWKFGNQQVPSYTLYDVETGYQNMAVIKTPLKNLSDVQAVDVSAFGFSFGSPFLMGRNRLNYLNNDALVCKQAHPSTPNWSIIVLRTEPFPLIWKGQIRIANQLQSIVSPDIDNGFAHSGKSSLKVTDGRVFEQGLLKLDSGKTYIVNAWVSVNNPNVTTPKLADDLGIVVNIKNRKGDLNSAAIIQPQGPIIEGWQQVRGSFTCPINDSKIELVFKPGSKGTAWYDDLRLHPEKGNMKSYVYNLNDYRLQATLDEENFASFYFYDKAGNLKLVKKETEDGVKTVSENITYQVERN